MREAWNARDDDDVRVTFDRNVAGSSFDNTRPTAESLRIDRPWVHPPIDGGPDPVVLELKFNGRFPRWMNDLVCSFNLYRSSMAKYVQCVTSLVGRRDLMRSMPRRSYPAISQEPAIRLQPEEVLL